MSTTTKIKICGITNLEDARYASGAMADYLGFIFYDKSPRFIEPGEAGAIINWIEGPEKVGVFVNQPLDEVNSIARQCGLDLIQLHGNESVEYCELIQKPIIKAIHISPDTEHDELQDQVNAYAGVASFFLFDTKIDGLWGGTGQSFEWKLLNGITGDVPFFLSGGLNSDDVVEAIQRVKPYGVDVSSSLEEKPGIKDFYKIDDFMDRVRSLDENSSL